MGTILQNTVRHSKANWRSKMEAFRCMLAIAQCSIAKAHFISLSYVASTRLCISHALGTLACALCILYIIHCLACLPSHSSYGHLPAKAEVFPRRPVQHTATAPLPWHMKQQTICLPCCTFFFYTAERATFTQHFAYDIHSQLRAVYDEEGATECARVSQG